MAVAVSATASLLMTGTAVSTFSFSITAANLTDYILIGTAFFRNAPTGAASVSVGSTLLAATNIASHLDSTLTGNHTEFWLFPVSSGTTGAKTINLAYTSTGVFGRAVAAVLTGVDSTTPSGSSGFSTGNSSLPSISPNSSLNDMVFGCFAWDASIGNSALSSGTSGATILATSTANGEGAGMVSKSGSAGATTINPHTALAGTWTALGININASTAAAAGARRPMFTMMGAGR